MLTSRKQKASDGPLWISQIEVVLSFVQSQVLGYRFGDLSIRRRRILRAERIQTGLKSTGLHSRKNRLVPKWNVEADLPKHRGQCAARKQWRKRVERPVALYLHVAVVADSAVGETACCAGESPKPIGLQTIRRTQVNNGPCKHVAGQQIAV